MPGSRRVARGAPASGEMPGSWLFAPLRRLPACRSPRFRACP